MNQWTEIILWILSFILLLVLLWFTFTIINIIVTGAKCKKNDPTLRFCFNTTGKAFYSILTILYVLGFFGGVGFMVYGIATGSNDTYRNALNVAAFISVVYGYFLSSIVLVGKKNLMVGRMLIDYRKLKKVNYTYTNKVSFVYAQHDYSFSTRFIDKTELRKAISK